MFRFGARSLAIASLAMMAILTNGDRLHAQVDPAGRSILFIRGADGSGGLGSGSAQRRTEHLSDIGNTSTQGGNHGFGELAATLRRAGFTVSQWIESNGALDAKRLAPHRIVVFGSNNRVYSSAEVAAFETWFKSGGSALFISDANWGSNWNAAPLSDNQFLSLVGASVYQDSGDGVPRLTRSQTGRFLLPAHPVVAGPDGVGGGDDVDVYDGEGVSWFEVVGKSGIRVEKVVSAIGRDVRLITQNGSAGSKRSAGPNDCALFAATLGSGRVVGHFDRNSWFNTNGTGSNITRNDNRALALRIFQWLASRPAETTSLAAGCGSPLPQLTAGRPLLAQRQSWTLTPVAASSAGVLLLSGRAQTSQPFPSCRIIPELATAVTLVLPAPDRSGAIRFSLPIPKDLNLGRGRFFAQALVVRTGGSLLGVMDVSTGLRVLPGFPF